MRFKAVPFHCNSAMWSDFSDVPRGDRRAHLPTLSFYEVVDIQKDHERERSAKSRDHKSRSDQISKSSGQCDYCEGPGASSLSCLPMRMHTWFLRFPIDIVCLNRLGGSCG